MIAFLIRLSQAANAPGSQAKPPKSGCVLSIPESMFATVTPLPVAWSAVSPGAAGASAPSAPAVRSSRQTAGGAPVSGPSVAVAV